MYDAIKLGSKVYYRKHKCLYTVSDRYTSIEDRHTDKADTVYELRVDGEPDSDFRVERHTILSKEEIQAIHDCIMEAANG